jgi:type IV pilus assembly protein PilY1
VLQKIDTGIGNTTNKNGLSSPIAVDTNKDFSADLIYAGDLYGNLWKFDVSGSAGSWNIVGNSPFFVACTTNGGTSCSTANRQPITSKPNIGPVGGVGTSQNGVGRMIYFGTGKYFETTDNIVGSSPQVQSFYGLWDHNVAVTDRSMLAEQTITEEGNFGTNNPLRVVSTNPVCYTSASEGCSATSPIVRGWALTLNSPVNPGRGERAVSVPLIRNGLVIFPTIIPDTNPCNSGGSSWLMEVNSTTGGLFGTAPFDSNGDGTIDSSDKISAGVDLNIGIIKTPAVVEMSPVSKKQPLERKYASGSTGEMNRTGLVEPITVSCPSCPPFNGGLGNRGSWQQLR